MIRNTQILEEDKLMKEHARRDRAGEARFDWAQVVSDATPMNLQVELDGEIHELAPAQVAEIVGNALSTLLRTREQEKDIFSEANQEKVAESTRRVAEALRDLTQDRSDNRVSRKELNQAIESALVRQQEFDLARSLVTNRAAELAAAGTGAPAVAGSTQLLRRNGQLVPWNPNKIEIAVRKSFLALRWIALPLWM